jgi:hypothetical protein
MKRQFLADVARDAYLDDNPFDENGVLKDGRSYKVPMTLADSAMIAGIRDKYRTPFVTRHGYVTVDARAPAVSPTVRGANNTAPDKPADPARNDWPSSQAGTFPIWGYQPGQSCRTVEGKPGHLVPHASSASVLICMPDDAAQDSADDAWHRMVCDSANEWRTGKDATYNNEQGGMPPLRPARNADPINTQAKREWPKGGYYDPSAVGGSQWPDPFRMQPGPRTGDECTTDDRRPGRIDQHGRCVASGRDQAMTNIGPPTAPVGGPFAEGGECRCPDGGDGLYVKQGDRLVCKPRAEFDHRTVGRDPRDAAYHRMCEDARNAWRGENWPR